MLPRVCRLKFWGLSQREIQDSFSAPRRPLRIRDQIGRRGWKSMMLGHQWAALLCGFLSGLLKSTPIVDVLDIGV